MYFRCWPYVLMCFCSYNVGTESNRRPPAEGFTGCCETIRVWFIKGGRWRPFITLWTSVTSMLHRNVWSLRSGAPFLTLILFSSLCGEEQWVISIDIHYKWFQPLRCYFSHSIHKWKQWNNLHFTCHDIKKPCLNAKLIEINFVDYLNFASVLIFIIIFYYA